MRFLAVLIFMAILIFLQIFLAKRENKWSGLILPVIAFLIGLIYPLNMVAPATGVTIGFWLQMVLIWLMGNIPTIVFLGIYFMVRN